VIPGLQEVVPILVLEGEHAVEVVGTGHTRAVGALSTDEVIVVECSGDGVVVGRALDAVVPVVAERAVIALAETDDVVPVLPVRQVGAHARADDVVP
jgi:hypothetical protein